MDIFKMMKQAMSMKSQMKEIQKKMSQKTATVEKNGVVFAISGDLKTVHCMISPEAHAQGPEKISSLVTQAAEGALEKAKEMSAEELKAAMGGMDIGGLANLIH